MPWTVLSSPGLVVPSPRRFPARFLDGQISEAKDSLVCSYPRTNGAKRSNPSRRTVAAAGL